MGAGESGGRHPHADCATDPCAYCREIQKTLDGPDPTAGWTDEEIDEYRRRHG